MKYFRVTWKSLVAAVGLLVGIAAFAADEFLPPELAFKSTARVLDERAVEVEFQVCKSC